MKLFFTTKQHHSLTSHPQEDFLYLSNKYPIFAVADGVTLNVAANKNYPSKSSAFEAAKIFCQAVVSEAEGRYQVFKEKDLKEIFELGNGAVRQYNISQGRTKKTVNYYDVDLFSATTAFLLIKNKKLFWFSLCDSGVKLFSKKGKEMFSSPDGWDYFPKNWKEGKNERKKIIERHRDYRNAVSGTGKLTGYGVVDGEDSAESYLNFGVLNIKHGDLIFAYTDGFENYFNFKKFIELFKLWKGDLAFRLSAIISKKSEQNPKKYGKEKTLIAVSI